MLEFIGKKRGFTCPEPYRPPAILPIKYTTIEINFLNVVISTTAYIRWHTEELKATERISASEKGDAWDETCASGRLINFDGVLIYVKITPLPVATAHITA